MKPLPPSELILNTDGSIYHLNLKPGDLAQNIITVGDPERCEIVASFFDNILLRKGKREFQTITGTFKGLPISVMSTGIGLAGVEILFHEVDALFNIDFDSRLPRPERKKLKLFRLGTSGLVNDSFDLGSCVVSQKAIGWDSLIPFYFSESQHSLEPISKEVFDSPDLRAYAIEADAQLLALFKNEGWQLGSTLTSPGFYKPQGRDWFSQSHEWDKRFPFDLINGVQELNLCNLEMETAGIYGFGKLLGHQCISVSALLAHRISGAFVEDAQAIVHRMIEKALQTIRLGLEDSN